jgi:hypothetical protein
MSFEDPELIRKMIVEIKKFADLAHYQEIKNKDKLQFQFAIREIFPEFSEAHPFLFRKIVLGEDLTFLYKMLDSITKIQDGSLTQQQVEMDLGTQLADKYVYPALNAAAAGNVDVNNQAPKSSNGFSMSLAELSNPDILNS